MLRICFGISDANNTYTLFVYDKDKITMKNLIPTPGFADIDFCSFGGSMLSGNAWHLNQDKAWTFQEYYENKPEVTCQVKAKDVCGKGIAWSLAVSLIAVSVIANFIPTKHLANISRAKLFRHRSCYE